MQDFLQTEYFDLFTGKQLLIIGHLFGLALGAGGAFWSDFLFTHILKDRKFSTEELGILKLTSTVVWIGLSILLVTGTLIFLGDSERLLDSTKFLAKITIIGVLTVNGVLFHFKYIPQLDKIAGKDIRGAQSMNLRGMFASGGLSGVSWAFALILGALSSVPYSYFAVMSFYTIVAVGAMLSGSILYGYYSKK